MRFPFLDVATWSTAWLICPKFPESLWQSSVKHHSRITLALKNEWTEKPTQPEVSNSIPQLPFMVVLGHCAFPPAHPPTPCIIYLWHWSLWLLLYHSDRSFNCSILDMVSSQPMSWNASCGFNNDFQSTVTGLGYRLQDVLQPALRGRGTALYFLRVN